MSQCARDAPISRPRRKMWRGLEGPYHSHARIVFTMIRAALMALVIATATRPQSAPRFVTAGIRPSKEIRESRGRFLPNGDVAVLNTTLKELITVAYSLQDNMIAGGPPWIAIDHYDLIAKAPPNTPMDTLRLMLRALLAEKFKLAVHTENRS